MTISRFFPDPGCRGFIPQKKQNEPLVVKVNEQISGKKNLGNLSTKCAILQKLGTPSDQILDLTQICVSF